MAPNSGFQIGLELTNLLSPIGGIMSRMGNLALADALKRSGSDIITETKMAALIGRHRLDREWKTIFKNAIIPSSHTPLSAYVDIALHAGAGPTVQEALRDSNPALLSMVVQLSLLSFACEEERLAYAVTVVIESLLESSGGDTERAPDYVSLLGTIRACRQQTAAFPWTHYFHAVEEKLKFDFKTATESRHAACKNYERAAKKRKTHHRDSLDDSFFEDRSVPYHALKALISWIPSLQNFPEERHLHIRTETGVATIIIWCHYCLGLDMPVCIDDLNIKFGKQNPAVTLEAIRHVKGNSVVFERQNRDEPLFTLSASDDDPPIEAEHRADVLGFGNRTLLWTIKDGLSRTEFIELFVDASIQVLRDLAEKEECCGVFQSSAPSANDVIRAARILFERQDLDIRPAFQPLEPNKLAELAAIISKHIHLFTLLIAFSRIRDLEMCKAMPLSLSTFDQYQRCSCSDPIPEHQQTSAASFQLMASLLLGKSGSYIYNSKLLLVSAWGWSIFLPCFTACDPSDLDLTYIHVRQGVPTRKGTRKLRIVDAPVWRSTFKSPELQSTVIDARMGVRYFAGISTAERRTVLIGNENESTFSVVQSFTWKSSKSKSYSEYRLGLREMLNLCLRFSRLQPCRCYSAMIQDVARLPKNTIEAEEFERGVFTTENVFTNDTDDEKIFKASFQLGVEDLHVECSWGFDVQHNEAPRWLQMSDFLNVNAHEFLEHANYFLAPRRCCFSCTVRNCIISRRTDWDRMSPDEKESHLSFVLL